LQMLFGIVDNLLSIDVQQGIRSVRRWIIFLVR